MTDATGWNDYFETLEFVRKEVDSWKDVGLIDAKIHASMSGQLTDKGERRRTARDEGKPAPEPLPSDLTHRQLALLRAVLVFIKREADAYRLPLTQSHDCENDVRARLRPLARRTALAGYAEGGREREPIDVEPVLEVLPADAARVKPEPPAAPRRPLWEIILDPQSIQWMLILGGVLFVVGLVGYLYAAGVFESPLALAGVLGGANALILGGGLALCLRTRFRIAGRALVLLACTIMPLNLWFYHVQGLFTVEGHLWVPALVMAGLYLLAALVLRDRVFVFVLNAGLTLTALLILSHEHAFFEIAAVTGTLVAMGLLAIHVERAFPEGDGPFTRRQFGLAFFWSGHLQLLAGLALLLGGQLAGVLSEAIPQFGRDVGWESTPDIVRIGGLRWLAIGPVAAAAYAYVYSDLVVRRLGLYLYLAAACLIWDELLLLRELHVLRVAYIPEIAVAVLAVTALLFNLSRRALPAQHLVSRTVVPMGFLLTLAPIGLALALHIRNTATPSDANWVYVGALVVLAVGSRVNAQLVRGEIAGLSIAYFLASAAAVLFGCAGVLVMVGILWPAQAPWLMLVPIAYIIVSRLYQGHAPEIPLRIVAHAATGLMVAVTLPHVAVSINREFLEGFSELSHQHVAAFFAVVAVYFTLVVVLQRQGWAVAAGTVSACLAVLQLLVIWNVKPEFGGLIFAVLGLLLLIGYRFAIVDRVAGTGDVARVAFINANVLLTAAFVQSALIVLGMLIAHPKDRLASLLEAECGLAVVGAFAVMLSRQTAWRRWYSVASIGQIVLTGLAINVFSDLALWQKAEIFTVFLGIVLLTLGHVGWNRERDGESDLTTIALFLGTLLVAFPLSLAVLSYRYDGEFVAVQELTLLGAGIVLLLTGYVFQLRSTTIGGAIMLLLYVLTLVLFLRRALDKLSNAALALLIGGGVLFALGLTLSVFRSFLLRLPEKIRRREGVFRVLAWR